VHLYIGFKIAPFIACCIQQAPSWLFGGHEQEIHREGFHAKEQKPSTSPRQAAKPQNQAPLRNLYTSVSEIIMEINDLRRVACAPDRPEQDRRRFCNRAFRR
jgi:hypothetical protein